MLLTDLHIHSSFSDGKHSIHDIIDIYGSAGFDAIAVTDHLTETLSVLGKMSRKMNLSLTEEKFKLYIETIHHEAERAWKEFGMLVIPGVELTKTYFSPFKSEHIVVLDINKPISPDNDAMTIAKDIRENGGLSIAAHPFFYLRFELHTFRLWLQRKQLQNYFDAWEIGNKNSFANHARKTGLPFIANSDFHHHSHLFSWKTIIDAKLNKTDILNAIRKQQIQFVYFKPQKKFIQRLVSEYDYGA